MSNDNRLALGDAFPAAFKAQAAQTQALWKRAEEIGVGRDLIELVFVRCSQINGCAFCLDVHVREGLKAGLSTQKLSVTAAWREAGEVYSEQEHAALALAEIACAPARVPFTMEEQAHAREVLGDDAAALLSWAAICINGWNRMHALSATPVGG
ncbi:carboxymuconolactone decarboxylase family protein [Corynebacterium sphenisci]|uniref:carboxymuconolactone decarboxylase family protein n=1 Tax=Corynebacterium sphenisci TaxID=191493 RepID=UPI0026E02865|nr:carboxymuconolactone decarboxylase family protein [Corynebacterium sphenisci]MDO5731475.1 carboxymuconolactone decarboxylase family protein [Corynebacterium sphenisci]